MTIRIEGVATVPAIYRSEGGVDVAFRKQDSLKLSQEYISGTSDMVVNHDDQSFSPTKGKLLKLSTNDEGELKFISSITDDTLEEQILKLMEDGGTPNVSPQLVPKCDSISKLTLDDGTDVYYADEWEIEHLSIVNKGRCDDTQGCGIHKVEPMGDKDMSDEMEALKLELEALKTQVADVEAAKTDVELKLSEQLKVVKDERDAFVQRDVDEIKALILTHNKEAKLDEMNDMSSLKIVLGALEDSAKGKAKELSGEPEMSKAGLRLEAAKQKRNEMFNI